MEVALPCAQPGTRRLRVGPLALALTAHEPWRAPIDALLSGTSASAPTWAPVATLDLELSTSSLPRLGLPRLPGFTRSEDGRTARFADHSEAWEAEITRDLDTFRARFALRDEAPRGPSPREAVRRELATSALRVALALTLPEVGGLLLHASALVRPDGAGFVFCGPSGEGKTTMTRRLGPGWRVLADDAVVLTRSHDRWWVGGTPLRGREGLPRSLELAPLAAICHLHKGHPTLELSPLAPGPAFAALLQRVLYYAAPSEPLLSVVSALAATPSLRLASSLDHDLARALAEVAP